MSHGATVAEQTERPSHLVHYHSYGRGSGSSTDTKSWFTASGRLNHDDPTPAKRPSGTVMHTTLIGSY